MRNIGKWFWLLNKRLYKKVTFVLILLLIPVLVVGYGSLAQEESGVLTITLAQEGDDPMAQDIMQELKDSSNLVRFIICDSPEASKKMVNDSKADAAWVFADDLENAIYRFVNRPTKRNAFVRVFEGQSTIPLKLAREKLSGAVFSRCSRAFYLNYLRENVPELDAVSDEALMQYYDDFIADVNLFEFSYMEGESGSEDAENANYLLAPVRGLLGVVIVLGGLAAAMYYMHDDKAGTFCLVPYNRKSLVEFSCQMIAVLNVGIVAWIALRFAGLTVSFRRELLLLGLNAMATSLFCMTIRRLLGKISAVGTALPLIIVVMLVVCPVFFDLGQIRELQYVFPPTYYVNAAYSDYFLQLMCIYCAILAVIYYLLGKAQTIVKKG